MFMVPTPKSVKITVLWPVRVLWYVNELTFGGCKEVFRNVDVSLLIFMTLHVTRWLFLCLHLLFWMWQEKKLIKVRSEFLTAVIEDQSTIFWNVTPCSLVEVGQNFRRTCCLHRQYGWQQWQRSPLKRWWIQPDRMTSLLRRQLALSLI
jgi:hypothetical protein